ncbi:MAG: hypothetical protein E6G39_13785 [Actinobacteria bacterium]|nr:MAG: hypothetical protein E6G39_13785 [Actinomycetota bacterium]
MATSQAKKSAPLTPESVQTQFIDGVKQANKAAIEALNTWVESVAKATPKPQLFPAAKDMQEAATSWFKFNNEMLELQKEFALSFVQTVAPLSAES